MQTTHHHCSQPPSFPHWTPHPTWKLMTTTPSEEWVGCSWGWMLVFTFLFVVCFCCVLGDCCCGVPSQLRETVYHPREGKEGGEGGRRGKTLGRTMGRKRDSHILKVVWSCQTSFSLQYGPKIGARLCYFTWKLWLLLIPPRQAESEGPGMIVESLEDLYVVCL